MAFTVRTRLGTPSMSNDAAAFALATDRMIASPERAFDAGLRPGQLPNRTASLLPGLLAATRTGLTPASDDELQTRTRSWTITS
jgi:hypothetical protein